MSESNYRTVLLTIAGGVLVALVTALLRVTWEFWGPMVVSPSEAAWKVYFLVLLVIGILTPLFALVREKVHWSARQISAVVLVGVVIGLAVGTVLASGATPARSSPAEHACMLYLAHVTGPHIDFNEIHGGLLSTSIAIVEPDAVRSAAKRLRNAIRGGRDDNFLYRVITVGGPDTELVEQVLCRAARGLPGHGRSNMQIIVVTPTPVSDNATNTLEEKGYDVKPVQDQFLNVRHGVAGRE
jgi:hypothetical protein